jgi:hypothetical protein
MTLTLNDPHALRAATIQQVQAAARAVTHWTEQEARLLDQGVRSHVLEALMGCTDPEALFEIRGVVLRLVPRRTQAVLRSLDRDWIERWEGWAALLDMRAAQLRKRASSAERVHFIKHVPEVLAAVRAHPGLNQTELAAHVELSGPNITRLLGALEDAELIRREKHGNAKRIFERVADAPSQEPEPPAPVIPAPAPARKERMLHDQPQGSQSPALRSALVGLGFTKTRPMAASVGAHP